ncbi:hypothetical protein [Streptomyces sp. NPDC008092]|uniref:hypothetical protein n=1 Tax=Streptomyces sp. NPDC008092 TaxID=3364808 RepID=UPI0036E26B99
MIGCAFLRRARPGTGEYLRAADTGAAAESAAPAGAVSGQRAEPDRPREPAATGCSHDPAYETYETSLHRAGSGNRTLRDERRLERRDDVRVLDVRPPGAARRDARPPQVPGVLLIHRPPFDAVGQLSVRLVRDSRARRVSSP